MKPHLPTSLLSAVLAVFATVSTHAVEIPSNFEQIDVWTPDYLADYSTLNSEDYVAFLLYMDSDFSAETMGTLTPSVSGGNIIIMSADSDIPVKASFVDGFSFYNNGSIKFDTLKQLSFDDSGYRTFDSGVELAITNVNDGDDSIADVVFNGNGGGYCAIFESHGSTVSITQNGGVLFSNYHNKWDAVATETFPSSGASGGAICSAGDIDISDNSEVVFYQNIAGETIDSYGIESQDMEGRCIFYTSMWQMSNNSGGAVRANALANMTLHNVIMQAVYINNNKHGQHDIF